MKLYYFDIFGRGEAIRTLFNHAKVPFEDIRLNREQFVTDIKPKCEFGQLPCLEVEGKFIAQSYAILRFLGRQYGYYSDDQMIAYQIDSALDGMEDLLQKYFKMVFEKDEERKKALWKEVLDYLPFWLTVYENRLKANTSPKHLVGDKLTIADFMMSYIAFGLFLNETNGNHAEFKPIVEANEVVMTYFNHLREELKDHIDARTAKPF